MNRKPESVQHSNHFFRQHQGNGIRFSITIYRHVIIHAQCQQVAHWHSKIWKHGIGRRRVKEGTWERGRKRPNKSIAACFGCFGSRKTEKERQRKRGKRHTGTDRHNNNTHAGQEKSISVSLTQKSRYGCNFMFFFSLMFIFFLLVFLHFLPLFVIFLNCTR